MEQQRDTTIKWEHIAANIGHFRALLGRNIDQLSFEDRQAVVQLLVEKVVVHPDGAVEVHHVLPFEEPPVAADPKKKGIPGEFYVLRLKQLNRPAFAVEFSHLWGRHLARHIRQDVDNRSPVSGRFVQLETQATKDMLVAVRIHHTHALLSDLTRWHRPYERRGVKISKGNP